MMKFNISPLLLYLIVIITLVYSCKKDPGSNPYATVNSAGSAKTDTSYPSSFVGLHQAIFSIKCAVPACHDGSFEPDFRTIESAYANLVYQPVVKKLKPWVYRIVPYDTAKSWLWQRINHSLIISGKDTSQGRMPLYSSALSTAELNNISKWILSGAKDMLGHVNLIPNAQPTIVSFTAYSSANTQLDTKTVSGVKGNPFIVDTNMVFTIYVLIQDDSTLVSNLIHNQLKLSLVENDFSAAKSYPGTYIVKGTSKLWSYTINSSNFSVGDTVYFHCYTNDQSHSMDTEYPRAETSSYYKTLWSFKIVPY